MKILCVNKNKIKNKKETLTFKSFFVNSENIISTKINCSTLATFVETLKHKNSK